MTGFVDLFGLDLDGVAAVFILAGGFHLESLSHAGFAGDFGGFIHFEVSGGLDEPDGHCHDDGVVVGAGVVAGNLQFGLLEEFGVGVVVELFLGFRVTLLGQLNLRPAGILARYFGAGVFDLLSSCSEGLLAILL